MATIEIKDLLKDLYAAPLEAAIEAEEKYLEIWEKWLKSKTSLLKDKKEITGTDLEALIDRAPIVKLQGFVDVGITMHIAEISTKQGSGEVGINLGVAKAAGRYEMFKSQASESTFQASTRMALTNTDYSLKGYLKTINIQPKSLDDLFVKMAELKKTNELSSGNTVSAAPK